MTNIVGIYIALKHRKGSFVFRVKSLLFFKKRISLICEIHYRKQGLIPAFLKGE